MNSCRFKGEETSLFWSINGLSRRCASFSKRLKALWRTHSVIGETGCVRYCAKGTFGIWGRIYFFLTKFSGKWLIFQCKFMNIFIWTKIFAEMQKKNKRRLEKGKCHSKGTFLLIIWIGKILFVWKLIVLFIWIYSVW